MTKHMYGKGRLTAHNIQQSMEAAGSSTPWQAGLQVRVNHLDCPAGADTKRRLYVKRPMDSASIMIAYCHNCGCNGHIKERASRYGSSSCAPKSLIDELQVCNQSVSLPSAYIRKNSSVKWYQKFPTHYVPANEPENWTMEALRWLIKSGITQDEMIHYEYHLDVPESRIWHPIYPYMHRDYSRLSSKEWWKERIGAQGRAVGYAGRNGSPKYVTLKVEAASRLETKLYTGTGRAYEHQPMLVICEDQLSAIRLVEPQIQHTIVAVPLFGSNIRTEYLFELLKAEAWHRIIIWLDNDVDAVLQERERIAGALKMVGVAEPRIVAITEKTEPKHLSIDHLNEVLMRAQRGTLTKGCISV